MTDYLSLVGRGTAGFRDVFAPGSPMLAEDADTVYMAGFHGSTSHLQWRIWIPPGTKCLQATLYTYASPPESKILMRMHQPPAGTVNNVTPENAAAVDLQNVLALLMTGAEVPAYTPSGAGAVKLSDGRMDSPVVTTSGAWLYINALQTPGAQIFQLDARLTVDKAQYQTWYEHAVWDDQGNPVEGPPVVQPIESHEERVLRLLKEAELVAPLMALAGVATDIELGKKALATGVWAGLLRLIK
jgi:hypothetical protein